MPAVAPINWTNTYKGIYDWFFNATGLVTRWAPQKQPRADPYPYATLNIIAGPSRIFSFDQRIQTLDLTRFLDVKMTPIANDTTTYTIAINGTPFAFVSDASATIAEITAGLEALINAGAEPVTATDNGTNLDIVATDGVTPFLMVLTDSVDNLQMSAAINDTGVEFEIDVTGYRLLTVSCQVLSRTDNAPASHPRAFLSTAESQLEISSVLEALKAKGLAVEGNEPITDISVPIEDKIELRASMDVMFRVVSSAKEYTGFADQFGINGTFEGSVDSPIAEDFSF